MQVCIVDAGGAVRWTGKTRSEPDALARLLRQRAPGLVRAVLESGALSGWLCVGLVGQGLPAICIDARAAHGALKQRRGKTDRSGAEGYRCPLDSRAIASADRHGTRPAPIPCRSALTMVTFRVASAGRHWH